MKDLNHADGLLNLFNNPPHRCEHRVSLSGFASTDFFFLALSNNSAPNLRIHPFQCIEVASVNEFIGRRGPPADR